MPVVRAPENEICAVHWLELFLSKFPKSGSEKLFALDGVAPGYNNFLRIFNILLNRAGVVGDFATHSLRTGGATHMSMSGCTVAEVKERGRWKSDCVDRYIVQPLKHKVKVDKEVVIRV